MEVRELKAKDTKTLARMLGKLKSVDAIVAAAQDGKNPAKVAVTIFHAVAADVTDDLYAWMAELVGMEPAEFDETPANTPALIIKKLIDRGDFQSFFDLASGPKKKSTKSTT